MTGLAHTLAVNGAVPDSKGRANRDMLKKRDAEWVSLFCFRWTPFASIFAGIPHPKILVFDIPSTPVKEGVR